MSGLCFGRVVEGELAAIRRGQEPPGLIGMVGCNQNLHRAEPVESQAVRLAKRFPGNDGGDVVRREEGSHLGLLDLSLCRENDHWIVHGVMVTRTSLDVAFRNRRGMLDFTGRIDTNWPRCYDPNPLF